MRRRRSTKPDGELERFQALLDSSEDLKRLVRSPVFSADEQIAALKAIFSSVGISGLGGRLILLAAKNRRLSAVSEIIQTYRTLDRARERRGHRGGDHRRNRCRRRKSTILKGELAGSDRAQRDAGHEIPTHRSSAG